MTSVFTRLSSLTLLFTCVFSSAYAAPRLASRQAPGGDTANGYTSLPELEGIALHRDWEMLGATFPLYLSETTEANPALIERAVIHIPGKLRDCWGHATLTDNALKAYTEVPYETVSTMVPCYLTDVDLAGAAQQGNILFGLTTWASGHQNTQPTSVSVSAYDVLDELINYYLDTTKFPNLKAVVIAGHSLGAQMAQRYAAMRTSTTNDDKIHYWVANPGSFMWLVEDRPAPNEACEGVDKFKFGLSDGFPAYALADANTLGREGLVQRYLGRKVHYAQGLADGGPGDTRCQAVTQGVSHLERGQNFESVLVNELGGMPAVQTIDYIEGVSHDGGGMVNSAQGLEKLFSFV